MLAGRAYNIYDRGVNCDIPRKLRHRYGANVIPLDFLVTGAEAEAGAESNMFWILRPQDPGGRASGRQPRQPTPGLHHQLQMRPRFLHQALRPRGRRRPLLVLQFDGHGNDAGYMTRCEAYLDSKGILRCYQPTATIH